MTSILATIGVKKEQLQWTTQNDYDLHWENSFKLSCCKNFFSTASATERNI